jgi:hypothetical protein
MPQRPVPPGRGRDEDPGRAEEDWLAWCEALEASGEQLDPDDGEEPDEDAAPWEADLDAIIAECRQVTAEEAALAVRAAVYHRADALPHVMRSITARTLEPDQGTWRPRTVVLTCRLVLEQEFPCTAGAPDHHRPGN